jgi:hypothetical protein
MACYTWMLHSLLQTAWSITHILPPPPALFSLHDKPTGSYVSGVILFGPLLESLILVGVIELLRWVRSPVWSQIVAAALVLGFLHSTAWRAWGFIVAADFGIQAFSYLYWRAAGFRTAFTVVFSIHALHNLVPALSAIAYATRPA